MKFLNGSMTEDHGNGSITCGKIGVKCGKMQTTIPPPPALPMQPTRLLYKMRVGMRLMYVIYTPPPQRKWRPLGIDLGKMLSQAWGGRNFRGCKFWGS